MRAPAALLLALLTLPGAAYAEVQVHKGQGVPAPTQPVTSSNLAEPVFQSDTRNLEAILDKDETARITRDNAAKPKPAAAAAAVPPAAAQNGEGEDQGMFTSALTGIRVFAIRWREFFDIIFTAVIAFYVRKLYQLSREQQKILSHAIRSAEYSAAAAKRSADICENLLQGQEKPDEAQHRFDLR